MVAIRLLTWITKPHYKQSDGDRSRGESLFLRLMLLNMLVSSLGLIASNYLYIHQTGMSIWNKLDIKILLAYLILIGVSYSIVRSGFYKVGVFVYISISLAVSLIVPFVPDSEIALIAAAIVPIILTAMIFSYKWVAAILSIVLIVDSSALFNVELLPYNQYTGFVLLMITAIIGALVIILSHHLAAVKNEHITNIKKTAAKYKNLFETVADGIFIANQDGIIIEINRAACLESGFSRDELIGMPLTKLSFRSDIEVHALIADVLQKGFLTFKTAHQRKDGTTALVELSLSLLEDQGETSILGVARDITERETEMSFREAVIARAAEGLCVCHQVEKYPYLEFTVWNRRMSEITGFTIEEINQFGWLQTLIADKELRSSAFKRVAQIRPGNEIDNEEWTITRKDGEVRTVEITTSILVTSDSIRHVLVLMHDITTRKIAEKALVSSEKRYRDLFNSVMEGIGLVDSSDAILFANPAFASILDCDSPDKLIGKSLMDFIDPTSQETLYGETKKRLRGFSSQYELTIITAQGNRKYIYCSITPIYSPDGTYDGALGTVLDITEKKQAEITQAEIRQKLERAERMESLGILAGGVAHDLNNMIGPVAGYAELLLREISPESKLGNRVQKIINSARDAADVIQDLLTLARRGRCEMSPVQMNDIISAYLESPAFLDLKKYHPLVAVAFEPKQDLELIGGSSPHLAKVIMNLISNACEAMPDGGYLTVKTEQQRLETLLSGFEGVESGDYILVRVKDTGVGIAKEDQGKIFEPYYSRKKMGRSGSGLGLSVVYGVVKDHHGYYDVFSEPGKGTEFVLYFPISTVPALEEKPQPKTIGGDELILVADDNAEQRELMADILGSLGYKVIAVESGREAVKAIARQPAALVILDMIMEPDYDGLDTYSDIISLYPGQPCVVVSGYAASGRVSEMQQLGAGEYIRKPYTIDTIARAVRETISAGPQKPTTQNIEARSSV
jgi:PAS domain S-box-containing protein